ncbi:Uncharacterised protein [Serratia fonticola]|nr:Uncharacterised protein [Serratia fonticola]CAI1914604.1 Uncharacterised protein [Serratia fonticola]CAI1959639.1 Uncharacterised protein [Serratia fonticola]
MGCGLLRSFTRQDIPNFIRSVPYRMNAFVQSAQN